MPDIYTLPSGVTVIVEQIPLFQSASIGVFVNVGSCHETDAQAGISHFVEHMLFRGTMSRTSAELARAFDLIGGQFNAYTSKELTCFYAKTLDYHVLTAIDLLCDMVLHPRLDDKDIALEREVVLEEIHMVEDSPDDLVVEQLFEGVWGVPGFGSPILGHAHTVAAFDRSAIAEFMAHSYTAGNVVVSIAGRFDEKAVLERLTLLLGDICQATPKSAAATSDYMRAVVLKHKDIEQNHLCFGFNGYALEDPRYRALIVLSSILGDGMSSRLFQLLREQLGLVYAVSSFVTSHMGCGLLGIYSAQQKGKEEQAVSAIVGELNLLKEKGANTEELTHAKEMLKIGMVLTFESSNTRMGFNAREFLRYGRIRTLQSVLDETDQVTSERLMQVAEETLDNANLSLSVVGRLNEEPYYRGVALA